MELDKIYLGNALDILKKLEENSIDVCITSPPYYMLRSYLTKPIVWGGDENCVHDWSLNEDPPRGGKGYNANTGADKQASKMDIRGDKIVSYFCSKCYAWLGDLGKEPSPYLYIKHLVDIFREVKRVLKPAGTLWLNIGDSYAGSGGAGNPMKDHFKKHEQFGKKEKKGRKSLPIKVNREAGLKRKDIIGIPWELAFSLRRDGWFLRQDIIWVKGCSGDIRWRNVKPESVKDRFTKSHEYIFLLSKSENYYFDMDSVTEKSADSSKERSKYPTFGRNSKGQIFNYGITSYMYNFRDKSNRRSVWFVRPRAIKHDHFAAFCPELVTPCILAGSPAGGVVLDPFVGSGTTIVAAKMLNRHYIGIDISEEYVRIAEKRVNRVIGGFFD